MFAIRPECAADGPSIEALLDRSFGPDRHRKVSYRYRDGVPAIPELSFVAAAAASIVGAIRYWPIRLDAHPALLLGPLAIDPQRQGRGIGRALVFHSLDVAMAAGHRLVFLVGDPGYYARFGFALAPAGIVMPGEQPARLNFRRLGEAAPYPTAGTLHPADSAPEATAQRGISSSADPARADRPGLAANARA